MKPSRGRFLPRVVLPAVLAPALLTAQQGDGRGAGGLAAHADAPVVEARRTAEPIRVDGRLDEAAWGSAVPVTALVQTTPDEGAPATERTEVRILFDAEAIYVGARMYDRQALTTRLGRRDADFPSDWLTVAFDSYHDHRTAYAFAINPSGVRRDGTREGGGEDDSWDPVWLAATSVDEEGWTAELRIPFSQLRFNPGDSPVWGIQIERTLARREETAVLSFTPSTHPGGIARYGHLHGLSAVRAGRRTELLPYVVARAESVDRSGNAFREDRSAGAAFGADAKYRITSDLTLDATVNPDFGQVDVDPAEVNLTAIETFFQERRPFFVEGSEIFNFGSGGGNNVFYSRRIGRAPQVVVDSATDVRDAARILAAGKVSGRTGGGWSVGLLGAATERVEMRYLGAEGEVATTAEPFTGYLVGRLRRDARDGQTVVGGMGTAVRRDLDTDLTRARLHAAAYTGGVDFAHQWAGRTWSLTGFVSGSHVRGTPDALLRTQQLPWRYFQRPDAGHLSVDSSATSLTGLATEATLSYRHGRHWRFTALGGTITPGYDVSDIGFQFRADRIDAQVGITYLENRPGRRFRQWNAGAGVRNETNHAGERVQTTFFGNAWGQANSFWSYSLELGATLPSFDDRLTRGGPLARRPGAVRAFTTLSSDRRKPVTLFAASFYQRTRGGGWTHNLWGTVELRPSPSLSVSLAPSLNRTFTRAQFLGSLADPRAEHTFGRRYLFSELRQTVLGVDARLDVNFTPGLSLQVYAQPFLASTAFGDPGELAEPRSYRFRVYGRDVGDVEPREDGGVDVYPAGRAAGGAFPFHDPDFGVQSLRGNAVLRWEWRPGSTLFLAWQQLRSGSGLLGDFDLLRDQRALWRAQPDNVLMLKVSYWLNP